MSANSGKYWRFAGPIPRCATPRQYEAWKETARLSLPRTGFCEDCEPFYQAKMKRQGRCEHPEVVFFYEPPHRVRKVVAGKEFEAEVPGGIYGDVKPRSHKDLDTGKMVVHKRVEEVECVG